VLSGQGANTNFIIFGFTRPEPEPTIYHTRGVHTNHNTTDAVQLLLHMTNADNVYFRILQLLECCQINIKSY